MATNQEIAFFNAVHGTNYTRYIFTQDTYKHAENGLEIANRAILIETDSIKEANEALMSKLQELGTAPDASLTAYSVCEFTLMVINGVEKHEYLEIQCGTRNMELIDIANRLCRGGIKPLPQKSMSISVSSNLTLTKAHIMRINSLMNKYECIEDINLMDLDYISLKGDFAMEYQISKNKLIIRGYNPQFLIDYCTNRSYFDSMQEAMDKLDITRATYSYIKKGKLYLNDTTCDLSMILPW